MGVEPKPEATPAPAAKPAEKPAAKPAEQAKPAAEQDPLAALTAQVSDVVHRLSSWEGRVGRLLTIVEQTNKQTKAEGTDTPSQRQIAEAVTDSKKFRQLTEEFPEWGEAIEERLALERSETLKQVPRFDEGKFRGEFLSRAEFAASRAESREIARLDAHYNGVSAPDWEETIQSQEFIEFAYADGPNPDERQQYERLQKGVRNELGQFISPPQPGKADALFKEFGLKYPKWWGEHGALLASPRAVDAGKLLKEFHDRQQQAQEEGEAAEQAAERRRANEARLRAAVSPQGVPRGSRPESTTEEEAAKAEFRRIVTGG